MKIGEVAKKFSVFSFNFAKNIHYPTSPQQAGPAYFKTARKCSVFGIHDERSGIQGNYLIGKSSVGKNSNAIISSFVEWDVSILFADNFVRQNENNSVIQYLFQRTLTNRNVKIKLNFLVTGYTKFSPDRNFRLFKIKYARTNVDCLNDAMQSVTDSSPNESNVAVSTIERTTGNRVVRWSY